MKNNYIPISCAFYDEFEAAAVKKSAMRNSLFRR